MFEQEKVTKRIIVEYEDGSQKIIERGMCFGVSESDGEYTRISVEGSLGGAEAEAAVVAIVSRIARDMGLDKIIDSVEEVE